jgi:type I restriction enzyme S subunit
MKQVTKFPKLRFANFVDEWESRRLGEIGTVIRGSSPRPQGDKRYYGGNIPRLMVADVTRDGKYVTPRVDFLTEEGARLSRPCKAGTLTIVCSGTVGIPSFLAVNACIHDGFLALMDIDEEVSKDYVYHQLTTLRNKFERSATHGGVFTNLTTSGIKEFEIGIPSYSEQQKIAAFLSSVDKKIGQLTGRKELVLKFKKGLMQQIFDRRIRFKDDKGEDFPEWQEKKLGDIATFSKGSAISKEDTVPDGLYECIRYGELYTHYGETIDKVVSRTNVDKSELTFSEENDVIIPSSGETNIDIARAASVLRKGIALGGDLTIIRSNLNGVFLSYYLNSKKKYDIARLAQGVSVVHLYPNHLAVLRIEIPSAEEQRLIADFLSLIDNKIALAMRQIDLMKTFKDGLLQQMFV